MRGVFGLLFIVGGVTLAWLILTGKLNLAALGSSSGGSGSVPVSHNPPSGIFGSAITQVAGSSSGGQQP